MKNGTIHRYAYRDKTTQIKPVSFLTPNQVNIILKVHILTKGTLWWSPVSQILNRTKRRSRAPLLRPFQVGIISNLYEIFWESSYGLNYILNLNPNFQVLTGGVHRCKTIEIGQQDDKFSRIVTENNCLIMFYENNSIRYTIILPIVVLR